jgi:hypothetical protein
MIDTTAVMVVNAKMFVEPVQKGHEWININVAAFLIEHPASGKKVMFDLGVRKDYWNLPASMQKRLGFVVPALRVDKDVTEILQGKGVELNQICGFETSIVLLVGHPLLRVLSLHSADDGLSISQRDMVTLSLGPYRQHRALPQDDRACCRTRLQG